MTRYVTKAMAIQFINSNKLKSCKMGLTNHTWPISHHITPLVINGLRGGHTDTDTHIPIREQKRFQETRHAAFGCLSGFKNRHIIHTYIM